MTHIFIATLVWLASSAAFSQVIQPNTAPLFSSDESVDLKLVAPFAELFSQRPADGSRGGKDARVTGTITLGAETETVQIRMRGFSSLSLCQFPKLTLKFRKDLPPTSVFSGLGKLDVGTHCEAKDAVSKRFFKAMEFNRREALIYQWLKILDIPGYAARAAQISYTDTSVLKPHAPVTASALLVENLSSLLKRIDGVEIRAKTDIQHIGAKPSKEWRAEYTRLEDHPQIDRKQLAKIDLLIGFIGDFDHRLQPDQIWNYKLIELKDGRWLPIVLDFNLATIALGNSFAGLAVSQGLFHARPAAERIEHLRLLKSKLPELKATVTRLGDDPEGQKAFGETIDWAPNNLDYLIDVAEKENQKSSRGPN